MLIIIYIIKDLNNNNNNNCRGHKAHNTPPLVVVRSIMMTVVVEVLINYGLPRPDNKSFFYYYYLFLFLYDMGVRAWSKSIIHLWQKCTFDSYIFGVFSLWSLCFKSFILVLDFSDICYIWWESFKKISKIKRVRTQMNLYPKIKN